MRPRSGPLAALPPTGSARAPRRYATRSPRATEQGKRPAGWQVRFIGWSASPVKSGNSATRRVLILPKVLVLTDLNVPFGRQRLLLGVLRVLDVAVLCLGLEVVPGSAGSPPGSALHPRSPEWNIMADTMLLHLSSWTTWHSRHHMSFYHATW